MGLFNRDGWLQLKPPLAGKHGHGDVVHHGSKKRDLARSQSDGRDVALQLDVLDTVGFVRRGVAQSVVVGVAVCQWVSQWVGQGRNHLRGQHRR